MCRTSRAGTARSKPSIPTVESIGDFGGDGRADILWKSDWGLVGTWQMSGASVQSVANITTVGQDWNIVGHHSYLV